MSTLKQTHSVSNAQESLPLAEQFDINLRQSCIDCAFVISCPIAQEKGGPDIDVLVGSYRVAALKERCLL